MSSLFGLWVSAECRVGRFINRIIKRRIVYAFGFQMLEGVVGRSLRDEGVLYEMATGTATSQINIIAKTISDRSSQDDIT